MKYWGKQKYYLYFFFFLILLMFPFLVLVSKGLLMIWAVLELSLFFFILVLIVKNKYSLSLFFMDTTKNLMVYIYFQMMGSVFLLFSMVFSNLNIFIIIGAVMKIGLYPFFWWFLMVSSSLSWLKLWFMVVLSKMGLFYVMSLFFSPLVVLMSMLKLLLGGLGVYQNLKNLKLVMMYNSVVDSSFLLLLLDVGVPVFSLYFLVYGLVLFFSLLSFSSSENPVAKLKNFFKKKDKTNKVLLMLVVLVGLPPFFSFFYKAAFLLGTIKSIKTMLDLSLWFIFIFIFFFFLQGFSYVFFFFPMVLNSFLVQEKTPKVLWFFFFFLAFLVLV